MCDSYKYRPVGLSVGVHGVSRFFPLAAAVSIGAGADIRPDAPGIQLVRLIELLLQQICCPFATLTEERGVCDSVTAHTNGWKYTW